MSSFELPVIDISKSKTHRTELAAAVVRALEHTGFLYIDNAEAVDFDKMYKSCQWFFSRSQDMKNSLSRKIWNPANSNIYRGYFPVGENEPSRKEGFEFARDITPGDPEVTPGNWFYEPSVWPEEDGTFPFKTFMRDLYEVMHELSLEILRLTAIGLGIDEFSFEELFTKRPCSTLRIMHYPPWTGSPPENARIEDGKVLTTPAHTDSTFLTLLATFGYKGLEIVTADGRWAEVEPRTGSLVMNIGDVFSRMMGGRFKATRHRVVDIGVDRYSLPFFLEPKFDGDIGENFMTKATGEGNTHVPEQYGPYVIHTMKHVKKYFEYRTLPEF
ncbi:gibberellin 2-beta-dioxygenase 4-like [Mizuhopecten yessoensis]|uniref:Isopenicillin N synthase n=1 Tax=Mizuhopecten yessoensis TaxID=6573 RepID=A0A210QL95_MIZYE|nr:gibberellin 2-beta-dioxygenase 4-like [Mizuhopecten yessoensis]OWF49504.1 Isopenicillin N synthase [Mizuhopecten yessoensis]